MHEVQVRYGIGDTISVKIYRKINLILQTNDGIKLKQKEKGKGKKRKINNIRRNNAILTKKKLIKKRGFWSLF